MCGDVVLLIVRAKEMAEIDTDLAAADVVELFADDCAIIFAPTVATGKVDNFGAETAGETTAQLLVVVTVDDIKLLAVMPTAY